MNAHSLRRCKIIKSFAGMGFKTFAAFLTVCVSLAPDISTINLAKFWRSDVNDAAFYSLLEDVLEMIKKE
jgi:hypothetical protein